MHQDQRIGLALGVLLLGAAGAFFFRNDPHPAKPGPRLKSAREVDARIAEKSLSPYLHSIKDEETSSTAGGTRRSRDSARGAGERSDGRLPSLDDLGFSSTVDASPNDSTGGRNPNRLQRNGGGDPEQNLTPIPIGEDDDIVSQNGIAATERSPTSSSERIHVVQKGESLSSISAKELGSSNRFLEIFEANRDQLKNPNDVRIGMNLRIPARESASSASSHHRPNHAAPSLLPSETTRRDVTDIPVIRTEDDVNTATPSADNAPSTKSKFEPAKRPPLGVQGAGPQANAPRRLSQIPPKEAGGKVAR